MKESDIFSDPILTNIYNYLIDGLQSHPKSKSIKQQARRLIKQILLRKVLIYYKVPKWFMLTLSSDETKRLYRLLEDKYKRLGLCKAEEEIKQEIEILNEYFDKMVENQINKEAQ